MRIYNGTLYSGSADATVAATGSWLGHIVYGSFQLIGNAGGSGLIGSMSLQYSNEPGRNASEAEITITTGINHWVTIGTPTPINLGAGATGSVIANVPDLGYRWVRPVFTNQSGTGTIQIIANLKGW